MGAREPARVGAELDSEDGDLSRLPEESEQRDAMWALLSLAGTACSWEG